MSAEHQSVPECEQRKVAQELGEAALRIQTIRAIADSLEVELQAKLESLLGQVLPVSADIQEQVTAFGPLRKGRSSETETRQIKGALEIGHYRSNGILGPTVAVRTGDALYYVDPLSIRHYDDTEQAG